MRRILAALLIGVLLAIAAGAARDVGAGASAPLDENDHLLDGVPGLGGPRPK